MKLQVVLTLFSLISCSHRHNYRQIANTDDQFITEILALQDGQQVPTEIINRYDPKAIGASIVERLHRKETKARKPTYDFYRDSQLLTFFNDNILGQILEDNAFKNGYQAGEEVLESVGYGSTWKETRIPRLRWENEMSHLQISSVSEEVLNPNHLSHRIRPSYAFVELTKPDLFPYTPPHFTNYSADFGFFGVILHDDVKKRATWTSNDSGILGSSSQLDLGKDVKTFKYISSKPPQGINGNWIEAQIWGGIGIEDIKGWMLPVEMTPGQQRRFKSNIDEYFHKNLERYTELVDPNRNSIIVDLKKTGIPIYEYHYGTRKVYNPPGALYRESTGSIIKIKRQIYAGDPAKMNEYRIARLRRLIPSSAKNNSCYQLLLEIMSEM